MNAHLGPPVGITLDRFIKRKQEAFDFATGELSQLLRDIALAGKIINDEISTCALLGLEGKFGAVNVQGEQQQKLDVVADIRFTRAFRNGGEVCAIISEEHDKVIDLGHPNGKYIVAIDPLDGSSNIDVNVSIGTIFSIYRRKSEIGSPVILEDFLRKGSEQIAAGYVLYGSSSILVYTTGHGVNGFTYKPSLGEFFLSHRDIKTPEDGKIFSVNEGYYDIYEEGVRDYIKECKAENMSARYIGSLVADFHRNMLKGGIYMYPSNTKSPNGKLRLMYECNSLAYIIEQAGGIASNGKQRMMDVMPTTLHQREPLYIGSSKMVNRALELVSK